MNASDHIAGVIAILLAGLMGAAPFIVTYLLEKSNPVPTYRTPVEWTMPVPPIERRA